MRKKTTTEESLGTPTEVKKTRKPRAPRKKKTDIQETTEVAPTAAETEIPVEQTKPQLVEQPEPQPVEQTKPQPVEQTKPQPVEQTKPQPVELSVKKGVPSEKEGQGMTVPTLPNIEIHDIIDLLQAPQRAIVLTDQQIQQLTLEEVEERHLFLENALANVLDYDVVISDTNIWLELLIGHTSSHSDPRVNARLQFERQLEFISKMMKYRGGKFMMMGETYEEIDRFACMQDPQDHKDADWSDNIVCLNAAARLAKRLILSQQRENRLRIEGIGAESHHAAFADPAIVRRVVELFAEGKKVLLLTNDASVAIRSMGLCDDLQRYNNISDKDWTEKYVPLRPMVFTFDDLKVLDFYTRQYHYIQMASGQPWMHTIGKFQVPRVPGEEDSVNHESSSLNLNQDAFRPGDKHRGDNLNIEQKRAAANSGRQSNNGAQEQTKQQQKQQPKPQPKQEQPKPQPKPQPKQEQPKQEPKPQPKQEQNSEPKQEQKQEQKQEETKKPVRKPRRRPLRSKKSENVGEEQPKAPSEAPKTE